MKERLAALAVITLFVIAISVRPTWTQTSGHEQGGAAPNRGSTAPGAMRTVSIFDPQFGVDFVRTSIPSGWFFQGGVFRGDPCIGTSSAFYRVNSPDGLSGFKVFPRLDLGWSNNPIYVPKAEQGCLPYEGDISAAGYMQYLIALLHVNLVKDITEPRQVEKARSYAQNLYGRSAAYFGDANVVRASFNVNGIPEEEEIGVTLTCHVENMIWPRGTRNTFCTVEPRIFWAPQGKLEATIEMLLPATQTEGNPEWLRLWTQAVNQKFAAINARNNAFWAAQRAAQAQFYANLNQQIIANGTAFRQQLDNQYQVHEQQIAAMQRGGDMSMARALANVNSQSRMAADACDYALGVQRRVNPETGDVYKTDSGFSYDWVNSEGHHILTNYVNDNPNGINGRRDYVLTRNEPN